MTENEKIVDTLVWGSVVLDNRKFYLLAEEPERPERWQPTGVVRWLVADSDDVGYPGKFYKASHIVFTFNENYVEILDNPKTVIPVEYFSADETNL